MGCNLSGEQVYKIFFPPPDFSRLPVDSVYIVGLAGAVLEVCGSCVYVNKGLDKGRTLAWLFGLHAELLLSAFPVTVL